MLERLFQIFNIDHPADYKGRSLSVSDIVILDGDSGAQCYYCEPIGFARLPFPPALP